jgi:phospholipid transport system substrate-binding protein
MNRFFLSAIILIFTINISYSVTYNSEPKIFITELIQDAMKTLSDKSISLEDKRKIIEKIALENVDINAIGKYTLGDFRKTLDDSNSRKYDDLFEKYFLKSITSRLTDYSNNKFEIISAEQKSSKYTIVKSKISESSSQPEIQIDWRVYTKDPLKPLIRDLVVEGLSLARTQKEEFSSILSANNNDVNFLFARLEKFIAN